MNKPQSTQPWIYSEAVKDHFLSPRNFLVGDPANYNFDAQGLAGNPICGDEMIVYIKVSWRETPSQKPFSKSEFTSVSKTEIKRKGRKENVSPFLSEVKWKTYGCASAIASTSALSELAKGKTLDEAMNITAEDIEQYLGGLPKHKFHCSVLGQEALKNAIENYRNKK